MQWCKLAACDGNLLGLCKIAFLLSLQSVPRPSQCTPICGQQCGRLRAHAPWRYCRRRLRPAAARMCQARARVEGLGFSNLGVRMRAPWRGCRRRRRPAAARQPPGARQGLGFRVKRAGGEHVRAPWRGCRRRRRPAAARQPPGARLVLGCRVYRPGGEHARTLAGLSAASAACCCSAAAWRAARAWRICASRSRTSSSTRRSLYASKIGRLQRSTSSCAGPSASCKRLHVPVLCCSSP